MVCYKGLQSIVVDNGRIPLDSWAHERPALNKTGLQRIDNTSTGLRLWCLL